MNLIVIIFDRKIIVIWNFAKSFFVSFAFSYDSLTENFKPQTVCV